MSSFEIPPLQIDPRTMPPYLLTSEPGSFAYNTIKTRIPWIIEETLALNDFPTDIRVELQELHAEVSGGTIRPLREMAPDCSFWLEVSRDHFGRSWFDVPWYWAEAFFYRRLLEATHYFQPGPLQGFDPFRAKKQAELVPGGAVRKVQETLRELPANPRARFETLLYASLWGNRADLSYDVAAQIQRAKRLQDERVNLLVDDAARVWEFWGAQACRRLAILADNAGTELLMDLALIDFVLAENPATQVVLHLKPHPFFVSDAMPQDVDAALDALSAGVDAARAMGARIRAQLTSGRLRRLTHWFNVTSLFYSQLPDDLRTELSGMDLVIVKGDANYRRLVGDAHWPRTTSFERVTAYFPAPLVALRTLKAELIVGLLPGVAEQLREQDQEWLVNGKRGIVQARL